tara:strand:- start:6069 stop:6296 length:228 start_codon:yes stop_codon:yes gene_type:complete
MTSKQYREMRQRITIKRQSGSYVVGYPVVANQLRLNRRERVFSQAIGGNAYAKARTFAKNKAKELAGIDTPWAGS